MLPKTVKKKKTIYKYQNIRLDRWNLTADNPFAFWGGYPKRVVCFELILHSDKKQANMASVQACHA